jgi:hypothetical protein
MSWLREVIERLLDFRLWPILLQKSLMASTNSDSVTAAVRFAVEAGDDGAAQ